MQGSWRSRGVALRGVAAWLGLAAFGSEAHGRAVAEAEAVLEDRAFATLEAAVRAAAGRFHGRSLREDREYMGAIFAARSEDGAFRYSAGAGERGRDEISVRIRVPTGARLVALWHTHGARHFTRAYFSELDTALANRLRLPLYLMTPGGELRVFRPGDATLSRAVSRRLRLGDRRGYARGAPVGESAPSALARREGGRARTSCPS